MQQRSQKEKLRKDKSTNSISALFNGMVLELCKFSRVSQAAERVHPRGNYAQVY